MRRLPALAALVMALAAAPANAAVTTLGTGAFGVGAIPDGSRTYVGETVLGVPGERRLVLPAGAPSEPASVAAAGGGVAVVRDDPIARAAPPNTDKAIALYAGPAGAPLTEVARCEGYHGDLQPPEAEVFGATVVWRPCPAAGRRTTPADGVTVFDLAGTRTLRFGAQVLDVALGGRTLAVVVRSTTRAALGLRLVDLDAGTTRTLAIPGHGRWASVSAQGDGTAAVVRAADSTSCGQAVSVVRPGAATATTARGDFCDGSVRIGGDRLLSLQPDRTARGRTDLVVTDLRGDGRQVLERGNVELEQRTDGTRVVWVRHACDGDELRSAPLDALPRGARLPDCPVRLTQARLTDAGKVALRVACPRGCDIVVSYEVAGGDHHVSLPRAGSTTLQLRLRESDPRRLRRSRHPAIRLTYYAEDLYPPIDQHYPRIPVRVR